jgi:hypothetical protein
MTPEPQQPPRESRERESIRWHINCQIGTFLGWTDLHGGPPHGTFWRGYAPLIQRCLELPDFLSQIEQDRTV